MKDEARDALGQALQEEELEVDHVMGEPFISNRCGLYFAAYPECLHVLEERDSAHEEIESTLKSEVTLLQGQVSTLKLSIPEYSRVRNRLISTFKRDKLNNAMESDIDIIQEGNIMAHEGDAAVDALLYEGLNGRHDPSAFEELYGIHPADVVKIRRKEGINILNTHTGIRADCHKAGTDEFYRRFAQFIQLCECFLIGG